MASILAPGKTACLEKLCVELGVCVEEDLEVKFQLSSRLLFFSAMLFCALSKI